jgi:hypothetical protein
MVSAPILRASAAAAAASIANLASPILPIRTHAPVKFMHPHLQPMDLNRYDSGMGLAIVSKGPDESTAEIIRDALTFQLTFEHGESVETMIAVFAMLVGLALVFVGVRLFRPLLFALSWLLLGGLIFFISMLISENSTSSFIAGTIIGFVFAALVVKLWKVSLFVVGGLFGIVLYILFSSLFPSAVSSPAAPYLLCIGSAIGFGYLATQMEKNALLVATPVLGAFLFLQGLDHFIHMNLNAFELLSPDGQKKCSGNAMCFGLYAALISLAAVGIYVQWKWTAFGLLGHGKPTKKVGSNEMVVLSSPTKKQQAATSAGKKGADKGSEHSSGNPFGNPFATRRSAYPSSAYGGSVESEYFEGN